MNVMEKRPKILVAGSLVMDLTVTTERIPGRGETILGTSFQTATGGKGANQAVQLARLGADVTMLGKVGRDAFGESLIAALKKDGIHTEYLWVSDDAASAVGNVLLEARGRKIVSNRIIVVPGANQKITLEDVRFLREAIAGYDMVLLQLEIPMEINECIAAYAGEQGVAVMLNPAPYMPLGSRLMHNTTYIAPNEPEAVQLTGIDLRNNRDEIDFSRVEKAARKIFAQGPANVLITLGDQGAAMYDGENFYISPSVDCGEVKDPTAAGDSFIGGFCMGRCVGLSVEQALYFANCTAAVTVSRNGAQPSLPVLANVHEVMDRKRVSTFDWSVFPKMA